MNVIVAIEFENQREFDEALQIAKHRYDHVDESMDYCVTRERGVEALACLENNIPCVAFDKKGAILSTNVDLDSLPADTRALYRARSTHDYDAPLRSAYGIEPLITDTQTDAVLTWPEILESDPTFLNRSVETFPAHAVMDHLDQIALSLPLFIKTVDKCSTAPMHRVFTDIDDLMETFTTEQKPSHAAQIGDPNAPLQYRHQMPDWYCPYRDSMEKGRCYQVAVTNPLILSEPIQLATDGLSDNGTVEYRCFMGHDTALDASRYVDYKDIQVPDEVMAFAQAFADKYPGTFGDYYVLDIGQREDGGLTVIELNPLSHSGRYCGIDPQAVYASLDQHYEQAFVMQDPKLEIPEPEPIPTLELEWAFD